MKVFQNKPLCTETKDLMVTRRTKELAYRAVNLHAGVYKSESEQQ